MAADKVFVYCKIPNGYHLTVKGNDGLDHTIRINGPANKKGNIPDKLIVLGCGVTEIPKDHWEAWRDSHLKLPAVMNGQIFSAEKESTGKDIAKERKSLLTGLEAINPYDPKHPGIEPDKEWLKKAKITLPEA